MNNTLKKKRDGPVCRHCGCDELYRRRRPFWVAWFPGVRAYRCLDCRRLILRFGPPSGWRAVMAEETPHAG